MTRTVMGSLGLLLLLPALQARDKPEKKTPAQQYEALTQEYSKALMEFKKAFKEAKTREDRQKVLREKYPQPEKYAPRYLAFAEKYPKDRNAVDALVWIVANVTPNFPSDANSPRTKALKVLLRNHVQSGKLVAVCQTLGMAQDEDSKQLLRGMLEKNRNRSVQAQACFALAKWTENRLRLGQELTDSETAKRYQASMDKDAFAKLAKEDPEDLVKEAKKLYTRILKSFAAVPDPSSGTMGKYAEGRLEALSHPILIGKPAPNIEGEDIDGRKFKLSDYRGKVVLLDFWGNW